MNIYFLQQDVVTGRGTYDSCVVIAENEKIAAKMTPNNWYDWGNTWCWDEDQVTVTLLGVAKEDSGYGVVIASYNDSESDSNV